MTGNNIRKSKECVYTYNTLYSYKIIPDMFPPPSWADYFAVYENPSLPLMAVIKHPTPEEATMTSY